MKPRMGRIFSRICISALIIVGAISLLTIAAGGVGASQAGAALMTPIPIADGAPSPTAGGGSSALWIFLLLVLLAGAGFFAVKKLKKPTAHTDAGHSACIADWTAARQATDAARRAAGDALGEALGQVERDLEELERSLDDASSSFASLLPDTPHEEIVPEDDSIQVVARVLAGIDGSGGAR
ncbi:MAG: hypothetical protein ACXVQV_11615 [Actinomycetota bacterium]